jgi:hypothetical protein
MADDEIVVEIEKEEPEKKAGEQTTDVADALKVQLTELQAETAREKSDRLAAQQRETAATQRAEAAQREVAETRTEITETRLGTVEQGLSAAQSASDAAKTEYKAAMEAGDWNKAAEAQEKLADARSTLGRLTEAKADLEVQKNQPQRREQRTEASQTQADPVEAFIQGRDPGTQAWLREHADDARALALDPQGRRAAKLNAADSDARAEGLKPGSGEYFDHVNKFLDVTKPNGKTANGNGQTQRRAASAPVAPVASSAGGVSGGTEVRLSAREARSATDGTLIWNYDDPSGQKRFKKGDPIGVQEMARRKLALKESGQYDKSLTEQ